MVSTSLGEYCYVDIAEKKEPKWFEEKVIFKRIGRWRLRDGADLIKLCFTSASFEALKFNESI